ncbi:Flp family type IVb pilin [Rhizobium puerariae]|uniref:Flp family type IVb pilin n=1 Tax=Rhizobium puerariae TaxID=1585791 RepID=A0ABV6AQB8_9HYPH
MRLFSLLLKNTSGATAVEYSLLISVIALVLFAALGKDHDAINNMFVKIAGVYENAAR